MNREDIDASLLKLHEPIFDYATSDAVPTKDDLCNWANSIDRLRNEIRKADFLAETWIEKAESWRQEAENMDNHIKAMIDENEEVNLFALRVIQMLATGRRE